MSSSSSSSSSSQEAASAAAKKNNNPPIAKRDEDRVVWAGKLPKDHPHYDPDLIRQSDTSEHALLDPPRSIPDPYGWIRDEDRTDETVLQHLNDENEYTKQMTSHLDNLRSTLYDEMIGSIQETDYTTPAHRDGQFWYYTRTNKGDSYSVYCRAPYVNGEEEDLLHDAKEQWDGTKESPILPGEQVYLNVNDLAKDQEYCSVGAVSISKSQKFVAYMVDFTGDEIYHLLVKNLETDEVILKEESLECAGDVVWGLDDETLFYIVMDDTQRPYQVYRRLLNSPPDEEDELIFQQDDEIFWTGLGRSSDDAYLLIDTSSSETSEVYYLDLKADTSSTSTTNELQCVAKRRSKVLYEVDHWNGYWVITSNVDETPNMRLMICPVGQDESQWKNVIINDASGEEALFDGGYDSQHPKALDGVETFSNHLVASGRYDGIPAVWVIAMKDNNENNNNDFQVQSCTQLTFPEEAYDVGVGANMNYQTDQLVLYYDSLVTPLQSLQVPLTDPNSSTERRVLKSKHVPGYQPDDYDCQRITVTSRDGTTQIPVSLVYRKDVMEQYDDDDDNSDKGTTLPIHLIGYGSYGACCEADFSATRLTLLNRGIVCAVAHVRGGGELGRPWYEEPNGGKYLCKENTFNDFVDIAKWLIDDKKLTTCSQLSIEGRSAGGLLIGATINQAPHLFRVAILGVPFVDVACTMVDSSIPLTTNEWEEWGNPNEEKFFDYMLGYSPVNNVKERASYPSCLLTGGLHDPRVAYWEPSKLCAELRHAQQSNPNPNPICLKMDMTAGHFSASDRYKYLKELSFDYAFLLDQLGLV